MAYKHSLAVLIRPLESLKHPHNIFYWEICSIYESRNHNILSFNKLLLFITFPYSRSLGLGQRSQVSFCKNNIKIMMMDANVISFFYKKHPVVVYTSLHRTLIAVIILTSLILLSKRFYIYHFCYIRSLKPR